MPGAAALLLPRRHSLAAFCCSAAAECELSAAAATNSPLAVLSYLLCTVSKFAANETGTSAHFQLRSLVGKWD